MSTKSMIRNFLALIGGIVIGSLVNMALVSLGPLLVPLPEGANDSTLENLRDSMALFEPIHFLFPFLAHALGTLVGAFVAARFSTNHHLLLGMLIGVLFLLGGIAAASMIGGPRWFIILDLVLAYLPMGYLGAKLAGRKASVTV